MTPSVSPSLCTPGVVTCCIAVEDIILEIYVDGINVTDEVVLYDETYVVQFVEPPSTSILAFTAQTLLHDGRYAFHCMCTRTESAWNMLSSFPIPSDTGVISSINNSFPTGWQDVDYDGILETTSEAHLNTSITLSNAATLLPQCAPMTMNFSAIAIHDVYPLTFWAMRRQVNPEYDCVG
jgi:hypothetical protein